MMGIIKYSLLGILAVLVMGSLVGSLMDRPVFMSYAYSGSMTPTIAKYDLFFINPFSTNPSIGDIIVFRSGDKWVVHRVVSITSEGYITKGDNNVATDQQSKGIPPVKREQIAGKVITVGKTVPKIPRVGNVLENGLSDRQKVLIGGIFIILGIIAFTGEEAKRGKRKRFYRIKFKTLYLLIASFLLIMIAISTFVSWERIPIQYAVTSAGGARKGWYLPGEEFQEQITVKNNNMYPMYYYVVSSDGTVRRISETQFRLEGGAEKTLTVDIKAPSSTSLYTSKITVNAYPPVLPKSLLGSLHKIHPMVPVLAILAEVSTVLGIVYILLGMGSEDMIKIRRRRLRTSIFSFLGVF